MELVRQKVYQLEQTQLELKQKSVISLLRTGFLSQMDRPDADADPSSRRYDSEIARLHRELEARGGPAPPAQIGGPPHNAGPSQPPPPSIGHGPSNLFGGIMAGQGGQGGPGLAPPPQEQPQPPPQQPPPPHQMPQPPPSVQPPGPFQAPQPAYQGYQPGPAVNGKLHTFLHRASMATQLSRGFFRALRIT